MGQQQLVKQECSYGCKACLCLQRHGCRPRAQNCQRTSPGGYTWPPERAGDSLPHRCALQHCQLFSEPDSAIKQPQKRGWECNTNPCNSHIWQQYETSKVMGHLHPNLFINKVTTYSKLLQAFTNLSISVSSLTSQVRLLQYMSVFRCRIKSLENRNRKSQLQTPWKEISMTSAAGSRVTRSQAALGSSCSK